MAEKNREIAVIFKRVHADNEIYYEPIKWVKGNYIEEEEVFLDEEGYSYPHISDFMVGNSFALRVEITDILESYPDCNLDELYSKYYQTIKERHYVVDTSEEILKLSYIENEREIEVYDIDIKHKNSVSPTVLTKNATNDEEQKSFQEKSLKSSSAPVIITPLPAFNVKEIKDKMKRTIIARDEEIDELVTTIWYNLKDKNSPTASNILINGPTGSGKTLILTTLANIINVPIVVVPATQYTGVGYYGKNVEEIPLRLLVKSNYDLVKAEHGIIVIDEIDKIAENANASAEVSTSRVQDELLTLLESDICRVKVNDDIYNLKTAKITFVGLGAFSNIEKNRSKVVGFERSNSEVTYNDIEEEDFIKYGMKPELLGRFPVRMSLSELSVNDIVNIIKNSDISALTLKELFLMDFDIETEVPESVITEIAEAAYRTKNGARGIRRIVDAAFNDIMREISENADKKYHKLLLKPGITRDKKRYELR